MDYVQFISSNNTFRIVLYDVKQSVNFMEHYLTADLNNYHIISLYLRLLFIVIKYLDLN